MDPHLQELYQELVCDHNLHPRNCGELLSCTHHALGHNPLCGDQVKIFLKIENNHIMDVRFQGEGCAISTASASMMTEAIKGQSVDAAQALFEKFHLMVTDENVAVENMGKLRALAGVREFPARVKCATLAWHTLDKALHADSNTARTE
jgi:nitrogen fixation NifU-like protein